MHMKHRRRRRKSKANIFGTETPDLFVKFIMRRAQVSEPRARVIRELMVRASQ